MPTIRAIRRWFLRAASLSVVAALAQAQRTVTVPEEIAAYPEIIIYNAKVVTMDDMSVGLNTPIGTIAQAVAVRDGKIQAVGTTERIVSLAGPKTERIDAKGRMVMPGIINTHTHTHNGALNEWIGKHPEAEQENASSYSVIGKTDKELIDGITLMVQEHVRKEKPGRWAFIQVGSNAGGAGLGAGVRFLAEKKYTMPMLDKISPQHPVLLVNHPSYVVNTAFVKGLETLYGKLSPSAAGLDDAGRIRSTAAQYRREILTDLYFHSRVPLLADITQQGLSQLPALGVTTYVSHIMGERFFDAFNMLVRQKRMPVRFAYTHWFAFAAGFADTEMFYKKMGDMRGHGSDMFWSAGVGLGSVDSGPPRFCSTMEAPKEIKELEWCQNGEGTREFAVTKTAIANYQRVQVGHAYADKGVDYFLDAVEAAMKENPAITLEHVRELRLSSDHCGFFPRIPQIPRMAKYGMLISCGAGVLTRSYPWIGPGKFAPRYVKQIAPIRSAIEGGVIVTTESSGGIGPDGRAQSPFAANVPFLTRKNRFGEFVSQEEAVDRNTLLKMMTNWAAKFVMKEDVVGTLEPGKWADIMVLSGDYFAGHPEDIAKVYPVMTVLAGKIVVLQDEFAKELGRSPVGVQLTFDANMEEPPPMPE